MKVIDPGHKYELANLDGDGVQVVAFVKREGEKYPGNVGHHEGTNCQEVMRMLIDRLGHLDEQRTCDENAEIIAMQRRSIYLLEQRAARLHGRTFNLDIEGVEKQSTCPVCGHIGCQEAK